MVHWNYGENSGSPTLPETLSFALVLTLNPNKHPWRWLISEHPAMVHMSSSGGNPSVTSTFSGSPYGSPAPPAAWPPLHTSHNTAQALGCVRGFAKATPRAQTSPQWGNLAAFSPSAAPSWHLKCSVSLGQPCPRTHSSDKQRPVAGEGS